MARGRKQPAGQGEFKCPECGRTFGRAAALGAHRRQAHGIAGTSSQSRSRARRTGRTTAAVAAASSSSGRSRRSASSGVRRSRSTSTTASSNDDRRRGQGAADRDTLLKALFPNGIPPKEDVIRAVNVWLDDAERLARMR
jgi:C2H2-type zinc finger